MVEHPRTAGVLWDAIGWKREIGANLKADEMRGTFKRNLALRFQGRAA